MDDRLFNIRYIKLHFLLQFTEDTTMPRDKTSSFRGGIGEMLLRCNCIRDRNCETCDFETECIVRRIMYAKSKITPRSVSDGESMGYIFECENKQEIFEQGDQLELTLLLFGNNIIYFNQYLQAISMLGAAGIGKYKSRYVICGIFGTRRQPLLSGNDIIMGNYRVENVKNYVEYRLEQLSQRFEQKIVFYSPVALKYSGKILTSFNIEAIFRAALRRLYMLDCFEGIDASGLLPEINLPFEIEAQDAMSVTVTRYSNHKNQHMYLNGITGSIELREIPCSADKDAFIRVLLAGELLHIGKYTSFGFGRYKLL